MTPKEKAEELVDKMYNSDYCPKNHIPNNNYCDCPEIGWLQAKSCAKIAADEVWNGIDKNFHAHPDAPALSEIAWNKTHDYWQQVKSEIEKL